MADHKAVVEAGTLIGPQGWSRDTINLEKLWKVKDITTVKSVRQLSRDVFDTCFPWLCYIFNIQVLHITQSVIRSAV